MTTPPLKIQLFNTLKREKEDFVPLDASNVRMYGCGPTVYNLAHIGNARMAVAFDVLYRLLRHVYGAEHVTYARNFTDIDDKIIEASRKSGEPIEKITRHFEDLYNEDMEALGCLRPNITPRCTEHIPEMIRMIDTLVKKGHAYQPPGNDHAGHVLFNVPSMPNYGQLSRKNHDELVAGARVEVAPYKKDAADFVLWKPSTPEQPGWDSPWGRGRPGWHIECSAMSEKHLGETFDIHAGGLDLIFPHHENEIAQSCCAHDGKPMANYWLHNGFLNMGDDKMSKSLGNVIYPHELMKQWHPEVIRLALLSAQYRQPLNFTDAVLKQCKDQLDRWYKALSLESAAPDLSRANPAWTLGDEDKILQALADDLNTPMAISAMHALADGVFLASDEERAPRQRALLQAGKLMGLLSLDPAQYFSWTPADVTVDAAQVQALVDARIAAKKAKNYAESDRLRDELKGMGIALEDTPQGTTWRYVGA